MVIAIPWQHIQSMLHCCCQKLVMPSNAIICPCVWAWFAYFECNATRRYGNIIMSIMIYTAMWLKQNTPARLFIYISNFMSVENMGSITCINVMYGVYDKITVLYYYACCCSVRVYTVANAKVFPFGATSYMETGSTLGLMMLLSMLCCAQGKVNSYIESEYTGKINTLNHYAFC